MDAFLFAIGFICTVYTVLDISAYVILRHRLGTKEFNRRAKAFLAPKLPKFDDPDWENY